MPLFSIFQICQETLQSVHIYIFHLHVFRNEEIRVRLSYMNFKLLKCIDKYCSLRFDNRVKHPLLAGDPSLARFFYNLIEIMCVKERVVEFFLIDAVNTVV